MEEGKSSLGSTDLPTGVLMDDGITVAKQIVFRELAGPEEDILASTSMAGSQKMTQVFANCTKELGSEKNPEQIRKLIEKMVITDRWFFLIELRCLSFGSNYKMETECPKCEAKDTIFINLKDLVVTNAPDATKLFHETPLPSGNVVRWKVGDGLTELRIEKGMKDGNRATIGLFARASEFNGKSVTLGDVVNLSMKDRTAWREVIDKAEGDFDDKFKHVCPSCAYEFEGTVNLEPTGFFCP